MLRLRKLPVAKNSVDNKGGYQDFPSMFFLSQNAGKFRRRAPLCCVSESFQ